MTPISGVYLIRNTTTGRAYIGSSRDIQARWSNHQFRLAQGNHYNRGLQDAWNADGSQSFSLEIIEHLPDDGGLLDQAERRHMLELAAAGIHLYSIRPGGRADWDRPAQSPQVVPAELRLPGLRRLRFLAALSQEDLAKRAQISPTTLSDLETGKTEARPSTVRKLAQALGVEPRELIEPS
jgi:DNA-binding XRE family transcriptional regulator